MIDVQIGGVDLIVGNTVNEIQVDSVSAHITDIDMLTAQIAGINTDIANNGGTATTPQLTQLSGYLTDLSQYIDLPSTTATGITDVTFNGVSLVSGSDSIP
jgi:hypothetical protein